MEGKNLIAHLNSQLAKASWHNASENPKYNAYLMTVDANGDLKEYKYTIKGGWENTEPFVAWCDFYTNLYNF